MAHEKFLTTPQKPGKMPLPQQERNQMTDNERIREAIREGFHNRETGGEDFQVHRTGPLAAAPHPKGDWTKPEDHPNWNLYLVR